MERSPDREELRKDLEEARATSLQLSEDLAEEEGRLQPDPGFSPLGWHLGHVGWQEEIWILRKRAGQAPIDLAFDRIFDSFRSEKASRGARLPGLNEIRAYLVEVRRRTLDVLESETAAALVADSWAYRFLANHERQHAETMAVVRLLAGLPLLHLPSPQAGEPPRREFISLEGCEFPLGSDDLAGWDNERGPHRVELEPFQIARDPVTNAEWMEFIEAGGYEDDWLWCKEGRRWRKKNGIQAPLHWSRRRDAWERRTLGGLRRVEPSHPVAHISWFEAMAYARYAEARLPTEAEWERAAAWDPALGRKLRWPWGDTWEADANLALKNGDTTPCAGSFRSPCGAAQMVGEVWEWTSSYFQPYPGFVSDPYRGYSVPWFGEEHRVLRGGSFLTHPMNARASFRNWFHPTMRAFPSGLRLARDG